jgi:hypothetical protein
MAGSRQCWVLGDYDCSNMKEYSHFAITKILATGHPAAVHHGHMDTNLSLSRRIICTLLKISHYTGYSHNPVTQALTEPLPNFRRYSFFDREVSPSNGEVSLLSYRAHNLSKSPSKVDRGPTSHKLLPVVTTKPKLPNLRKNYPPRGMLVTPHCDSRV